MNNDPNQRFGKLFSSILVGAGVLFLALSLIPGVGMKVTLPLIFLMAGAAFILMVFFLFPKFRWAAFFFIPGCLLLAFGISFAINAITGDWNAWAYAWFLLIAGLGFGLLLSGRWLELRQEIHLIGMGMVIAGMIFFVIFGAIAGGLFIQIMAPVLLVASGFALRWLGWDKVFPRHLFHRGLKPAAATDKGPVKRIPTRLVEPLSGREIEVLRLIDQGLSNGEIAARLTLAQSTVKTHINNIYGKLEVQTRVQAIKRGRELGLLND
jgi:DNA-binding CsgD family transcriptional regulator